MLRGAQAVAEQAMSFRQFAETATRVLVNGVPGARLGTRRPPVRRRCLTVRGGRIVAIDILADPERLDQLDLTVVAG